jgi:hypothetical protein
LWLDTRDRVEDNDSPIQHTQRSLDLCRKIYVAGRVNDVDAMIKPETGCGSRRNRYAALLLLWHPVHRRRPFMHLTHTVNLLGVEEDAFCRGRLTSINMSYNTDISGFFQWKFS